MKKFTLMLLAAFMAVVSFAGQPMRQEMPAGRYFVPGRKAMKANQPQALRPLSSLAKAARKTPRKIASIDELAGDFMLISAYYDYDETLGLVPTEPTMGGTPVTIAKTNETTLSITGFTSDATEAIIATVDLEAGTISIAENQLLLTDEEYGPVLLKNSEEDGPITGTITEDGQIELKTIWHTELGEGEYAGELWADFYYYSATAPTNGYMSWVNNKSEEQTASLLILQDTEDPKTYTVFNFGGFETAIDVTLRYGNKFIVKDQLIYDGGTSYGQFCTSGVSEDEENYISLTGTGTEATLSFDCKWSVVSSKGYWYGAQGPATITLTDETIFMYPNTPEEEEEEVEGKEVTFDFNSMDIPTSTNQRTNGDITEAYEITEGGVTMTISPKDDSATTLNRFWQTSNGPQLRVYSGTLTFEVPDGYAMTQIVFNTGKWNAENSADTGELDETTWEGEAQSVTFSIAGNTQINSIVISVVATEGPVLEPIVAPEGLVTTTYLFKTMVEEWSYSEEPSDEEDEPTWSEYSCQVQVGFDGDDLYIQGVSDYIREGWVKATKNEEGMYVIPANQYLGSFIYWDYEFGVFLTSADEEGNLQDIVLNYDPTTKIISTEQIIYQNDDATQLGEYRYMEFYGAVLTPIVEVAATPADPSVVLFDASDEFPCVEFYIPTQGTQGEILLESKLSYQIFIEKNGEVQPLTLTTDLYEELEEDMTIIPYTFTDDYDIEFGGTTVFLNQATEELQSWTKIGVQSIYTGDGVTNKSNIVWNELYEYWTGVNNVASSAQQVTYFDLQGRKANASQKGLLIMQTRQQDGSVKTMKVVRK